MISLPLTVIYAFVAAAWGLVFYVDVRRKKYVTLFTDVVVALLSLLVAILYGRGVL